MTGATSKFSVEQIPDDATLLRRVPDSRGKDGKARPGAFSKSGNGMSVEWGKYGTAEDCRQRTPKPERYGVVSLLAGNVRELKLAVDHTPRDWNRGHSDVTGDVDDPEVRVNLARMSTVEIAIPAEPKKPTL